MIEHLMSSSLSGNYQGCAAGFIRLHVRGLRSHQSLIARVVVCATGAVHTDIFRSIRYLPNPVPIRWSMPRPTGSQFRPLSRLRKRPARAVPQYTWAGLRRSTATHPGDSPAKCSSMVQVEARRPINKAARVTTTRPTMTQAPSGCVSVLYDSYVNDASQPFKKVTVSGRTFGSAGRLSATLHLHRDGDRHANAV